MERTVEDTQATQAPPSAVQFDALDRQATHAAVLGKLFGTEPRPRIGRYAISGLIGQGAMGRVYAAFDSTLKRDVAVKVIRLESRHGPNAGSRMVREAQAMARISHPNVVEVFEVGRHGHDVFIAMEKVRGRSLGTWVQEQSRPWPQCIEVLRQAGAGLAAAHAAGVLHRDFKPDNVMVDEGGRVRVLDFGVARALVPSVEADSPREEPSLASLDASGSLTRTGAAVGTPAYMAPEQMTAAEVDARCDQFAFCVTAFEILHGVRPFEGDTGHAILASMVDGRYVPPSASTPRWLNAALRRGLAVDPDDRWPSMDALLAALARGPNRPMRGGVFVGAAVAAALIGWAATRDDSPADPCANPRGTVTNAWNDETRQTLVGDAASAAEREDLAAALDGHVAQWHEAHQAACEVADATERGRQLDCLARSRTELRTSVEVLLDLRVLGATGAREVVSGLRPPRACQLQPDTAPTIAPPADPRVARTVAHIRDALARSTALSRAGRWDEAIAVAQAQLPDAVASGYPAVEAEVRHQLASALVDQGRGADATEEGKRAFFVAQQAGDERTAAEIAALLVSAHGWHGDDVAAAEEWHAHGVTLSKRLGDPPGLNEMLRTRLAQAKLADGKPAEAVALYREAAELRKRNPHATPLGAAKRRNDLANALLDLGEVEEAKAEFAGALETMTQALGEEHPRVASTLNNLGTAHAMSGDYDGARDFFERALAIREVVAPRSIALAMSYGSLGTLAHATERYDDAHDLLTRALALFEEVGGPTHPGVQTTLNNLASTATRRGDFAEARRVLLHLIEVETVRRGSDHPNVGLAHTQLGNNEFDQRNFAAAAEHYRAAMQILEARLGPDHSDVAFPLTGLGRTLLAQGDVEGAVATLERAVRLRRDAEISAEELQTSKGALEAARAALADPS
ncbi:MAG: serine/threonine-protein kinase [Myxococcota bacterium]